MIRGRVAGAWGAVGMLAAGLAAPLHADDQALQAILMKHRCVATKVATTTLAPGLVAYEISCRGRAEPLRILCLGADCRLQPKPRETDEDNGARQ